MAWAGVPVSRPGRASLIKLEMESGPMASPQLVIQVKVKVNGKTEHFTATIEEEPPPDRYGQCPPSNRKGRG